MPKDTVNVIDKHDDTIEAFEDIDETDVADKALKLYRRILLLLHHLVLLLHIVHLHLGDLGGVPFDAGAWRKFLHSLIVMITSLKRS